MGRGREADYKTYVCSGKDVGKGLYVPAVGLRAAVRDIQCIGCERNVCTVGGGLIAYLLEMHESTK